MICQSLLSTTIIVGNIVVQVSHQREGDQQNIAKHVTSPQACICESDLELVEIHNNPSSSAVSHLIRVSPDIIPQADTKQ